MWWYIGAAFLIGFGLCFWLALTIYDHMWNNGSIAKWSEERKAFYSKRKKNGR